MKSKLKWFALLALFSVGLVSYIGCVTSAMTDVAYNDRGESYKELVLSDEILAFGKPDADLAKDREWTNSIALLGKEHTYMVKTGGKELWQIIQLKLDADRISTDAGESENLYLENDRFNGRLTIRYDGGNGVSSDELKELNKAGFTADNGSNGLKYHKGIDIYGQIYPAVQTPDKQIPKLKKTRIIKFYANKTSYPSVVGKIVKTPLIVVGVAADVVLLPVYIIALGAYASHY
ncbi:MAG: hypothetical protein HXX17_13260 [Geobacteraceae bacterium]|nr:hypothetical protein [Geobacteraceae bacterium]